MTDTTVTHLLLLVLLSPPLLKLAPPYVDASDAIPPLSRGPPSGPSSRGGSSLRLPASTM